MKLIIYTDGASRGNPGPSSYGFTISKDGKLLYEEGKYIGTTTNNVAEYTAVLEALSYIKENIKQKAQIHVYLDSKLVEQQLLGRYKIKALHLKPIIEKIRIIVQKIGPVLFTHVPRAQNSLADKLANTALDSR